MSKYLLHKYSTFYKIEISSEQVLKVTRWCEDNICQRSFVIKNAVGANSWGLITDSQKTILYIENELDAIALKLSIPT